jgi:hypothetical protein
MVTRMRIAIAILIAAFAGHVLWRLRNRKRKRIAWPDDQDED